MKFLSYAAIAVIALTITGCDEDSNDFEQSVRSGTVANSLIEAPLEGKAKKYEQALKTSNKFLDLWVKEDFQTIHDDLIDPELVDDDKKEILSVEKLTDIHKNVVEHFGPIVGYKEMQWAFEPKNKKKQYFLFSIKTVQHEKGRADYLFQFLLDGGFHKLIGVYVRKHTPLRAPGQIHSNRQ